MFTGNPMFYMFPVVICKCVFPTDVPWKHSSYSSQPGSWRWIPLLHRSTTVLSADGYPEVRYIFMIHPVKNNDKDYTSFSQIIILYIYRFYIFYDIIFTLYLIIHNLHSKKLVGGLEHGFYFPQPDWGWWSNLTNSIIFQGGGSTTN